MKRIDMSIDPKKKRTPYHCVINEDLKSLRLLLISYDSQLLEVKFLLSILSTMVHRILQ